MRGERLREVIGELRELVERAQASMDDRPLLQKMLTALRDKVAEAEDADESEDTETEEDENDTEDKKE